MMSSRRLLGTLGDTGMAISSIQKNLLFINDLRIKLVSPGTMPAKSLIINGPAISGANINILTRMSGDACSVSPLGSYAPDSRPADIPRALGTS